MSKFSIRARIKSFRYAFKGVAFVFANEHNMWIHLLATVCVICAGFYFHLSSIEWLFISLSIGLVISAELANSAIEKLVDFVSPKYNEQAGLIKDIAAGAVLICAITAAIIGLIIFLPKLY